MLCSETFRSPGLTSGHLRGCPSATAGNSQLNVPCEYRVCFPLRGERGKKRQEDQTHWDRGRNPGDHRHAPHKSSLHKQQPGFSDNTSRTARKTHVRVGLNTDGARLIDCDIIPQEKWGKPRCANHFNLDLPSPLETSTQEKACSVSRSWDDLIPRAPTGEVPGWLHRGQPARAIRDGKPTKPGREWAEANDLPGVRSISSFLD